MAVANFQLIGTFADVSVIVSSIAVLSVSIIGARTFRTWKKEKLEEKRIELAEKILVAAYALEQHIDAVRWPLIEEDEKNRAQNALKNALGNIQAEDFWDWAMKRESLVRLERLQAQSEILTELRLLLNFGRVHFERNVGLAIELMLQKYLEVLDGCKRLGRIPDDERVEIDALFDIVRSGHANPDFIANDIRFQIGQLESELTRYLGSSH